MVLSQTPAYYSLLDLTYSPSIGKTHQSLSEQVQGLILVPVSPALFCPMVSLSGLLDQRMCGLHAYLLQMVLIYCSFQLMGL
jgi:hypothetical protein